MGITFDQVQAEVRRLASENPDFVYKTNEGECFYNPTTIDGTEYGACIFGQAFTNLGEPIESEGIKIGLHLFGMGITPTMRSQQSKWAGWVQWTQDRGTPWGAAVQEADRMYPII